MISFNKHLFPEKESLKYPENKFRQNYLDICMYLFRIFKASQNFRFYRKEILLSHSNYELINKCVRLHK